MAQLRRDYEKFQELNAEVIVVGPEPPKAFQVYFESEKLPFIGLPDPNHTILTRYGQDVDLFKFGRMPAQMVIDKQGRLRSIHYGHDMSDIPENEEILELLGELELEAARAPASKVKK